MVVLSPHSRRGGFSVFYSLEKSEKAFYFLDFSTFVFPPRRIKIKYILVRASHFTAPLFAAPTPQFNGYFNFFSSLRRAGLPQPARLHQEEKPKAETFTPSTVQKLPLSIIKAVFPAFMNLSFEWRSFSFAARFGFPFRSCFPLQSGAGAVPRPSHKRKFLSPLQALALKNGDFIKCKCT